jgi:CMP-2-keto-3-deoxyoctulosonic acid synthetase
VQQETRRAPPRRLERRVCVFGEFGCRFFSAWRHMGVYGYGGAFLTHFLSFPAPCSVDERAD